MNIVLLRFSSAGDIILTAELINLLKQIKNAKVFLAVKEANAAPAALTGALVMAINVKKGLNYAVKTINSVSPDIVIDLQGNFRSKYTAFFTKAKEKYYYSKDVFRRRFMVMFKWFLKDSLRIVDRYINTAAPVLSRYGIRRNTKPQKRVHKGTGVLIHGGAKWPRKRWPFMYELAGILAGKKHMVTITGLKDEVEKSSPIVYHKHKYISDLTGRTDFMALADLVKKSGLVVCNDSVVAHLARLYNVPCMVFMGPTCEAFGFVTEKDFIILQTGILCRPCHIHGGGICPIGTFECMKNISAAQAADAAAAALKKEGKRE